MATISGKKASSHTRASSVKSGSDREFAKILEGLKHNKVKIAEFLKQRVGSGDWDLSETNVRLDDEEAGTIDMVFSCLEGKKEKYILVDVSVPHLGIGQKYVLPTQAKVFQKQREVPATRIKKAIILVRKGTETISVQSLKIRCPIIEIQIENILKQTKTESTRFIAKERIEKLSRQDATVEKEKIVVKEENNDNYKQQELENNEYQEEEPVQNKKGFSDLSEDLLYALKEAVVHETLSTTYKRSNKYIRRGLWHWIEREIMDPNVHFFLIILSSIYQSKTGEILSKKFRSIDSYISNPDTVINAIFSRENALADEIKRNSERHKKALTKFLGCFSQTPPFEYLKSVFLKEFRSSGDGLKSRMSVFTTLMQLLARCGFEGEKEINYPLEILDELKVFQGIMCGNYDTLRTDNASKKLKHLVPQIEWEADDIYALRDQLAKILGLPSNEFNLNAYLPQAFVQDAKNMAENRKEALKQNSLSKENKNISTRKNTTENTEENQQETATKLSRSERMALQKQAKLEKQAAKRKYDDEYMPKKHHQNDDYDMPMLTENGDFLTEEALMERSEQDRLLPQEMDDEEVKRILDDPYAYTKPTSKRFPNLEIQELEDNNEPEEKIIEEEPEEIRPQITDNERSRERRRSRYADVDESRHRNFENFGGIDEEDPDVIKLSLALARQEEAQEENQEKDNESYENYFGNKEQEEDDDSLYEEAPTKTMIMQGGFKPKPLSRNISSSRKDSPRKSSFHHRSNNDGRNENRSSRSNSSRGSRSSRNSSSGSYRDSKKYYPQRNNSFRRSSSRRDRRD